MHCSTKGKRLQTENHLCPYQILRRKTKNKSPQRRYSDWPQAAPETKREDHHGAQTDNHEEQPQNQLMTLG